MVGLIKYGIVLLLQYFFNDLELKISELTRTNFLLNWLPKLPRIIRERGGKTEQKNSHEKIHACVCAVRNTGSLSIKLFIEKEYVLILAIKLWCV